MNIRDLLHLMIEKKASDIHIKENRPPLMRIHGKLTPLETEILSAGDLKEIIYALMDERQRKQFEETNEMDLAYNLEGVARFRANAFKQMGKFEIVLRAIPIKIPSLESLNLPAVLSEISLYPRGLVLVTGTTGSGKSTTLAAMIDKINQNYSHHIVTIEDPIEFVHADKRSSVSQREIGLDTESWGTALKYVLRQDPDVILIGEMRDAVTVGTAVSAAETGHMVFSTLHTMDTIQTINRILDFFPKEQQAQVRVQLAGALRAVVSLRLVVKADGVGRVPACEVLVVTPTVRGYLEEGKIGSIKDLVKDGEQYGMQTFDQSLVNLYKSGLITMEEAKRNATSTSEIDLAMKGITSSRASAQSILDNMLKEQNRKELDNMIKEARRYQDAGRLKDAYAEYEKILVKFPGNKEVTDIMARLRGELNSEQNQAAIKGIIVEGLNIYKKGNIRGAIVKWQEGLGMDPNNAQILAYIKSANEKLELYESLPGIIEEGIAIYKTGKIDEAIAKWNEVMKLDPDNKQARAYIESAKQKKAELKQKKDLENLYKNGCELADSGDDLGALLKLKRAYNMKQDSEEIKKKYEEVYGKLQKEEFGKDTEAEIIAEAFRKGVDKLLLEDYVSAIREWKKVTEKRPLEKKLKDYIEKAKAVLKGRIIELMADTEEAYREKRYADALSKVQTILNLDPTNEFALNYMRDLKPIVDSELQAIYKEAIDLYQADNLAEARIKLNMILQVDPNHMMARKRLDEVEQRMSGG